MLITPERRHDHRFKLAIPLVFWPMNAPAELSYSAESVNISERGIFFETNQPVEIGLPVRVTLNVPEHLKLTYRSLCQFTGRVARIKPMGFMHLTLGVGVKFYRVEPLIDQICKRILTLGESLIKTKSELSA